MTMMEEIHCDLSIRSVPGRAQPEVDFISNPLLLQKSLYMGSESQGNFAGGSRIQLKILMSVTVVPAYSEAHSCSSRICACIWSTFLPYYYNYLTNIFGDCDS